MKETWKTKVIAVFIIISSFIVLLAGLGTALLSFSGENLLGIFFGIIGISLGIFGFVVSSALHKRKKWAYMVACVLFGLSVLRGIYTLVSGGELAETIGALLATLMLILLYFDRNTFFGPSVKN